MVRIGRLNGGYWCVSTRLNGAYQLRACLVTLLVHMTAQNIQRTGIQDDDHVRIAVHSE